MRLVGAWDVDANDSHRDARLTNLRVGDDGQPALKQSRAQRFDAEYGQFEARGCHAETSYAEPGPAQLRQGGLRPAYARKVRRAVDVADEPLYLGDKAVRRQRAWRAASKDVFTPTAGIGVPQQRSHKIESVHASDVVAGPAQHSVPPAFHGADPVWSGPRIDLIRAETGIDDVIAGTTEDEIGAGTCFQARPCVGYHRQSVPARAANETAATGESVSARASREMRAARDRLGDYRSIIAVPKAHTWSCRSRTRRERTAEALRVGCHETSGTGASACSCPHQIGHSPVVRDLDVDRHPIGIAQSGDVDELANWTAISLNVLDPDVGRAGRLGSEASRHEQTRDELRHATAHSTHLRPKRPGVSPHATAARQPRQSTRFVGKLS